MQISEFEIDAQLESLLGCCLMLQYISRLHPGTALFWGCQVTELREKARDGSGECSGECSESQK